MKPFSSDLKSAHLIRSTAELRRLVDQVRHQPLVALDTEANSLFVYYERVCLIQLSSRQQDYIIDPLVIEDMSPLGDLLADPAVETVFHAAEYDIMLLKRDFNFTFSHLFDTMHAARICGWQSIGLAAMIEDQFGVHVDKRYQKANWSLRPLPPDQLRYAQMDTHFLPELRDRLAAELARLKRLDEACERFAELAELPAAKDRFDPQGYWRFKRSVNRSQMALVRELYLTRDALARQHDEPLFKVFSDGTLVELARLAPRHLEDLRGIGGLSDGQFRRYGEKILEAIRQGRQAKPPQPLNTRGPAPEVQERYEALQQWRKQCAIEQGVDSDLIIPRDTLWELARRVPTCVEDLENIPGLSPRRRAKYGAELIDVVKRTTNQK